MDGCKSEKIKKTIPRTTLEEETVAVLPLDAAGDTSISRPSQSGEGNFFSHSFQAGGQFVFCECGLKVYATRALFFSLAQLLSALPTIT